MIVVAIALCAVGVLCLVGLWWFVLWTMFLRDFKCMRDLQQFLLEQRMKVTDPHAYAARQEVKRQQREAQRRPQFTLHRSGELIRLRMARLAELQRAREQQQQQQQQQQRMHHARHFPPLAAKLPPQAAAAASAVGATTARSGLNAPIVQRPLGSHPGSAFEQWRLSPRHFLPSHLNESYMRT
jgi:hypothetical protein